MSETGGDRMLCSAALGMGLDYAEKKHCLSWHNG